MWDPSSSRASVREEVGSSGPARKVEEESGRTVEVPPACGALVAGDLNISEVSWERHPFMEGSFLLCAVVVL